MHLGKLFLTTILTASLSNSFACSKVTHNFGPGQIYSAHAFDFCMNTPVDIAISPRGMQESGGVTAGTSLKWTSKYANITVREHLSTEINASPLGINEKGLAVHLLYLSSSQFPSSSPQKASVNLFKFTKFVLDNYATVDEVLKALPHLQIVDYPVIVNGIKIKFPVHFAFDDASGDTAIVEYINGQLKIYHGKEHSVLTNEPNYSDQLANLAKYQTESINYSANNLPGGSYSANRFIRAYYYNANLPTSLDKQRSPVSYLFSLLSGVSSPYYANYLAKCEFDSNGIASEDTWPTKWTAVLDHNKPSIYFHNNTSPSITKITLANYNLNPGQAVTIIAPN